MRRLTGKGRIHGLTLLVVVAACGGNTTDERLSTELPPEELLRDLTPAESSQFCQRVNDFIIHQGSDVLCRYFGVSTVRVFVSANIAPATDADASKQCADMEATCHENLEKGASTNLCRVPSGESTCSATVAEYEACFDEHLAAANRKIPRCAELRLDAIPDMLPDPTLMSASSGPACARFFEHCPSLPSVPFTPGETDGGAK